MRWPYVSRAGLRQNHEWLVGGLELGVAVTRSGWSRTAIYYTTIWGVSRKLETSVNQERNIFTMMDVLKCTQIT